ncbi:DUF7144 family membrane protein [Glycomyces tritici]|uniref:DUF7144 domain-containing protein n=1 Tax=Glycomyces tritici TaxID=2665176 RepID=A0ABT7YNB3_9ACTN|nr:hypothetical protein [Glycomyces tritici]MDN3240110.1 hypothetical protein [Glycomyces tritici]
MTATAVNARRLIFPALMLVVGGGWQAFTGIAAIAHGGYFTAPAGYAFEFNIAAWGWVHLIVGVFAIAVGIALFSGRPAARLLALILASASLIANFLWLPIEPGWSIAVIGLDAVVIWALATAGGDRP